MRKALLSLAAVILAFVLPSQASAQCTDPDGVSGVMVWNQDYCVTQICTGTQWIAVHPRPINCLGGPGDNIPNVFDFTDVDDANLGVQYIDSVTVEGFVMAPLTASVTGGGAEIRNVTAGSSWGASADMNPGEELAIRMTASGSQGTAKTAEVTLGTATVDWVVTTSGAADTTPDPFDFVDVANATTITQYDDTVAVTGFDGPLTASVSGGGAEIRNNTLAGPWGASADLNPGNVLEIRMTSDSAVATAKTANVTFGTAAADWVVTTAGDSTDPVWSTAAGTVATIDTGDSLSTTVTATDDSGSVSYAKQSGDAWISVNSSTGELTGTAPGSAGTYSITVRAEDPSGNFTDRTFDVVVQDNTDPVWSTAAGTVATINTGDSLSTTVTATDDSGSVSYAKQSGDAWISVNSSTGELTGTAPGSAGTYSITVRAEDPSGNFTDQTFDVVVQDGTDPVWSTAAGTVATINTGDALSTTVTATDDSGSVTYAKQSGDAWISVNAGTGELTGTAPGSAGTYSITVRAEDPSGNVTDRTFEVVVQDNTDPVWTTAAGTVATINTGDSLSTTVTATDDSGSVSYAKQSGDAWISVNAGTGELTGTAPGTANTYSITVRAEDPAGNFTDRTFDVVVQDNTDPVWSTAAGTVATINTGDALSTTVTATDDSGTVSYAKQSGAGWISVNASTGELTGTAPGTANTYSITVRAQDPSGNFVDRTFNVVVQDGTDPVWSTGAGTVATVDAGDPVNTSVVATDDSGSVTYIKQSGPTAINVASDGSVTVSGADTGSAGAGTYSFTVRAEDPSGNFVDRTFDVVVQSACGGLEVGGYCWYLGATGENCDQVCGSHGGCNLSGTRDYAGSGGTLQNCENVVNPLTGNTNSGNDTASVGIGCINAFSITGRITSPQTTCGANPVIYQRACACNN